MSRATVLVMEISRTCVLVMDASVALSMLEDDVEDEGEREITMEPILAMTISH